MNHTQRIADFANHHRNQKHKNIGYLKATYEMHQDKSSKKNHLDKYGKNINKKDKVGSCYRDINQYHRCTNG